MIAKLKRLLRDTRGLVSDLYRLTLELGGWVLLLIFIYQIVKEHLR